MTTEDGIQQGNETQAAWWATTPAVYVFSASGAAILFLATWWFISNFPLWIDRVHEEPILSEHINDHYGQDLKKLKVDKIQCRWWSWFNMDGGGYYLSVTVSGDEVSLGSCSAPEPYERVLVERSDDGSRYAALVTQVDKSELGAEDAKGLIAQVVSGALLRLEQRAEAERAKRANEDSWSR